MYIYISIYIYIYIHVNKQHKCFYQLCSKMLNTNENREKIEGMTANILKTLALKN